MEDYAVEIQLIKKRSSRLLLPWILMSACLHTFLLFLPSSSPAPGVRQNRNELRVVAALRANFVPNSSVPPQVDVRRPVVFSPSTSVPPPPRLKSQPLRAATREVREPVVYEPTLTPEPVHQAAAQKKISPTLKQTEAALQVAALTPARSETAALNISASEEKVPQHSAADVSLNSRDAIPRYAENPLPAYPEVARRNGWRGEVLLQVSVSIDGIVERLRVQQSSGFRILDRAALRAVKEWRFYPASRSGRAVVSEILVPVEFHLSQSI